jgi:putative tryptophan/tyrosine transport system substrate-binding protein
LEAKRLQLLHDLVPKAARIAVLVNPANPATESAQRGILDAARALGLQIQVLKASTKSEIEAAFATLARDRTDALHVAGDGSSRAGVSNWPRSQRSIAFPRFMPPARLSKPVG